MGQISMEGEMGQYFNRKTYSSFTGCGVKWVTSEGKMGHFTFINKIPDGEDGSPEITKRQNKVFRGGGAKWVTLIMKGKWHILLCQVLYLKKKMQ